MPPSVSWFQQQWQNALLEVSLHNFIPILIKRNVFNRDSERRRGFLGSVNPCLWGSSPVAGDVVAASLGLVGLDDNAVFLKLLEEAVLSTEVL